MQISNSIILGDCTHLLTQLAPKSVDVCITSPPYKNKDGYTAALMYDSFGGIHNALKDDGLFFLNFGHLAEDKFRPFRVCDIAMEIGFQLNETVTWVKNHYRPIQGHKRVNNLSEFIFILYKKRMPKLDRLAIGVPYADKSNAKRFAGGRDLKCRGNVWYIPYETINSKEEKLHNDRFPLELPLTCLRLSGLKSGLCLDPFSGSGTTCLAAMQMGLQTKGFEKDPINFQKSLDRLQNSCKIT